MTELTEAARWVLDRDDRLPTCLAINALHDPAAGVVVMHRSPQVRGLGHDLLAALGKTHDALGWPASEPRAWRLAELWLAAAPVDELVVYGAHRLADTDVDRLTRAADRARARLWLVTRVRDQALADNARGSLRELLALNRGGPRPQTIDDRRHAARPTLCADADFLSFRARCWWLLGGPTLHQVEARLEAVMTATADWLVDRPEPGAGEAGALIEQLLLDCRDSGDVVVTLRAMQLAFFDAGWLLGCETRTLCDMARPLTNTRRGPEQAYALGQISAPDLAALGALTACTPTASPHSPSPTSTPTGAP